jgi:ABC-2 type transport system permease protein
LFYFLIFGVAIGTRIREVGGVPYMLFIVPGLFVQNLINGSYSNPSGSLFMGRMWGHIDDILAAPISTLQVTLSYIFAGMCRGIFLGIGTIIIAFFFTRFAVTHWWLLALYILLITFVFACAGIVIGLWAKNWEQLNIFINFVVTPLTFLGGVFYTLDMVPPLIATITQFNPIFYMINGMRYGMIGVQDGNTYVGLAFLVMLSVLMFGWVYWLIHKGYNLKN